MEGDNEYRTIEGVDSEELLSQLLEQYADRRLVMLHRAVIKNDLAFVTEVLEKHPEWKESTLMPLASYEEVVKCNGMDYDSFTRFPGVVKQKALYPEVKQFTTGDADEPNELYPIGEYDQPETNLDTVFWTPLLRACYAGNTEMIMLLVDSGANKDYRSPCGANVISMCLESIQREVLVENLTLVRTDDNVLFADFIFQAIMDEDLATVDVIQGLLDIGVPIDKGSELFQDDWRSWVNPDIVALLEPYFADDK
jgi:hypothetical protein